MLVRLLFSLVAGIVIAFGLLDPWTERRMRYLEVSNEDPYHPQYEFQVASRYVLSTYNRINVEIDAFSINVSYSIKLQYISFSFLGLIKGTASINAPNPLHTVIQDISGKHSCYQKLYK